MGLPAVNAYTAQDSIAHEWLMVLRRQIRWIAGALIGLLCLAAAYLALVPAKYTATAVILVDPRQERVLSSEAVVQGIGQDAAAVESQVEIINSNELARRIVDQLRLDSDSEFKSAGSPLEWLGLGKAAEGDSQYASKEKDKIVNRFQKSLDVRRRGLTYILEVNFTSQSAAKSAKIANAIADAYIADQLSAKRTATSDASDWLSSRIDGLKEAVKESEQAAVAFKTSNNLTDIGSLGSGQTLNQRQIEELNSKLINARAHTAETSAKLAQVSLAADRRDISSLSEAMASRVLGSLRQQHAAVATREADLSTQLLNQHPALISIRSQRIELERKMKEELDRIVKNARSEHEIAGGYQASLEKNLTELERKNTALANLRVRFDELEREANANRTQYAQLLARQKETNEQKSVQRSDARIVSKATPPVRSSSPGPLLVLALALVAGLGLGTGLAILNEGNIPGATIMRAPDTVAPSVRREIVQKVDIPPDKYADVDVKADGSSFVRDGRAPVADATAVKPSGQQANLFTLPEVYQSPTLATFVSAIGAQPNLSAKAYRRELARLCNTIASVTKPELAAVTFVVGTQAGAGASSTALALASQTAQIGKRTLLIDACASDQEVSLLFCSQAEDRGGLPLDSRERLQHLVVHDETTGADILPLGSTEFATLDQMQRTRLLVTLRTLASDYASVVIDAGTPPDNPGSAFLKEMAQLVLVVTRRPFYANALSLAGRLGSRVRTAKVVLIGI